MRPRSLTALACVCALSAPGVAAAQEPADLVDPFVGTAAGAADFGTGGGAGNTFPGATVPFGMVQFSPDTLPGLEAYGGGYSYSDSRIAGFSLRHLSGPGCSVYMDVPLMPTTAPVDRSPAQPLDTQFHPQYVPGFSHDHEEASPGSYRVRLDTGVDAELTATTRSAVGRFSFPATPRASLLVNAAGSAMGSDRASVQIDPETREVSGSVTSGSFCYQRNRYTLHFVARFDRAFDAHGTWKRQRLEPGGTSARDVQPGGALVGRPTGPLLPPQTINRGPTAQTGGYVTFDARDDRDVEVRVGVSFVSVENARENLEAESAGRPFGELRSHAGDAWRQALGRIEVEGGETDDRRTFYTALYHSLLHPSTFSDTDGTYRGMDGEAHRAVGFTKYADFSGWDTYRTQAPLLAMIEPQRAADMVSSLVADARESGWLPKWSVANGQTGVMVGDPAASIIAGTYAMGARAFDADAALAAMVRNGTVYGHSPNNDYVARPGLIPYMRLGWVPYELNTNNVGYTFVHDLVWGSSATTLEYAVADHAIARLAHALGERDTCATFSSRGGNWRNVLDPATNTMARRSASGRFLRQRSSAQDGFVEGNAEQYTWFVPHDVAGLIDALGGAGAALARLDRFFAKINAGPREPHAFLGNEPTLSTPWIYAWLGRPDRTQDVVRRAMLELYSPTPGGFPGNDDLGSMSAWWVMTALGLHPAVPGTDVLALSGPLFPAATVRTAGGRTVQIDAEGAGRRSPYVASLSVDGVSHDRAWLRWGELANHASLDFGVAPDPQPWARDGAPPPSFGPGAC